jgi:hypothetical protein
VSSFAATKEPGKLYQRLYMFKSVTDVDFAEVGIFDLFEEESHVICSGKGVEHQAA